VSAAGGLTARKHLYGIAVVPHCHVMHLRGRPCECSSCTRPRWLSLSGHQLIQPCQIHSVEAAYVRINHSDCSLRMITCNRLQLSTSASAVDRQLLTMSATRPPQNKMIFLTFLQAVSRLTSWSVCMRRGGGGTKRVSLLLSNPRDLCQATASHWRDAQPTTVFVPNVFPRPSGGPASGQSCPVGHMSHIFTDMS
jgi:hypothetical protein